jgi:PAS domain S-box-containing protein
MLSTSPRGSDRLSGESFDFLAGGGEMGARMRAHDWSATPLGAPSRWPQSLRTVIRIMLSSRYAMWMAWGPELTFFCNDTYLPTVGVKEDWVLGARSDKVWAEIWPDIGPRIAHVLASGEATWDEGLLLFLERRGFPEETYHTFSYSPLADDSGVITGMLCVVTEETERILGERRLTSLRDLGGRLAGARSREAVVRATEDCLAMAARDMPFALFYLIEPGAEQARLTASSGIASGHKAAPAILEIGDAAALWPLGATLAAPAPIAVDALDAARFGSLPTGPWEQPPGRALVLPIAQQGQRGPTGIFIAGLNPYRPLDTAYRGYLELFVGQVAAGLASADAYEAERRRSEELVALDRAKTRFFSNISHEFRTPLTLMLGPLEDALASVGGSLPPAQLTGLEIAHRNALRLLRLVNALLDFSRIEAGRVQARFRPTDLAGLTAELASSFRSAMERAGLRFVVSCPAISAPVFVDTDMWEKIVLNLLSNAFKFTLTGGVTVELGEQAGAVRLVVRDTGTGIPPTELPRLFERFHRVESAKGRSFEGSGIGLALVHELVKLHGGEITVESELGAGSVFAVTLPVGSAHLPADQIDDQDVAAAPSARAQSFVEEALRWLPDAEAAERPLDAGDALEIARPAGGRAHRVLLADDNADLRAYIARLLTQSGYDVETVADGEAALAAARARPPDLIVSDVMMPGLDGFGVLAAIRHDPALRDLPVILLSARAGEEARVEGIDAGADDYLTKPFSARELLARIATNLAMSDMRRETAARLRELNETLELQVAERTRERDRIWRNSLDLLLVIGPDGLVRAVNPAWTTQLGFQPEEIVGRGADLLVHADDLADSRAALARVPSAALVRFENRHRRKDGRYRWIAWMMVAEAGVIYAVGRDVTTDKEAAEALRRAEEQLRQAQKMEAVGQLTGGIAHDFNNMLAIIVGSLDMLRLRLHMDRADAAYLRLVEGALDGANRASTQTQRLLAFSRQQALSPESIDANRLVSTMSELLRRTLTESISLETVLAGGLWRTHVDPHQLESAIVNLCVNARDAMAEGGKLTIETTNAHLDEVYVRQHPGIAAGQYVLIAVTDTGAGMSAEVLAKAFEPFFSTKPVGHGTGLGLAMVYGFVRQTGGHVKIYSEPGQGTCVKIYLPRHFGATESVARATAGVDTLPGASGSETVLVVEDDPGVRMISAEGLRILKYRVLEAESAAAALRLLAEHDVTLLFTDVVMPEMSGAKLAEAARRIRPGIKVLFTTGYTRNAIVHNGVLDAGVHMLSKPFTLAQLARKLAEVLDEPA